MSFVFTDRPNSSRINVWYDGIYLGEILVIMTERKDIDWQKYRSDKNLKMTPSERFIIKYIGSARVAGNMPKSLEATNSKEEAAQKILDYHREHANGK
tara:strand:+ start:567 stop:860 length:294 start_codon:yes stop_codon:yes gene_type:complete